MQGDEGLAPLPVNHARHPSETSPTSSRKPDSEFPKDQTIQMSKKKTKTMCLLIELRTTTLTRDP